MHRITLEYGVPADPAAFDAHYRDVHVPLASGLPGLRRFTVSTPRTLVAREPVHLVAELWFDDAAAMKAAATSPLMAEVSADADALVERTGVPWRVVYNGPVEDVPLV